MPRRATAPADFREALAVPALGIVGPDAIREAFEGDLRDLQTQLQGGLRDKLGIADDKDWMPNVHGLFDDFIVVEDPDSGKLLRYDYSVVGDTMTFGEPVEVRKSFETVAGADAGMTEAVDPETNPFLEASGAGDGVWKIRVIRAGMSGNGNYYPDAVLREALPLFEGVQVFVKSDDEHLAGKGKDVRNLIGGISDAVFVEGKKADSGEIHATLTMIEPDGPVGTKLREAWDRGMTGLFGFSIDATAVAATGRRGGKTFREARKFTRVKSVDLIVEPGAGGAIIDLLEAQKETVMEREEIIALLEARGLLGGKKADDLTDEALVEMLREALADADSGDGNGDDGGGDNADANADAVTPEQMREAIKTVEARGDMRARVGKSGLPQKAKDRIVARFETAESFTEAQVDDAIRDEAEYLAEFAESGSVRDLGDDIRIEHGQSRAEKVEDMLEAFFDSDHKDHRKAQSFRDIYRQITGDDRVTGILRNCDESLMREALDSSSFDQVLGDSIARRMVKDYNTPSSYDVWRQLTGEPVPLNDFRTQHRTRYGGYGDLPTVPEKDPYVALASPTDEEATYAAAKRGGTETVTIEMVKNDDVGVIRRIPTKMSRAAKRTLSKFVLDFVRVNPVIYDGLTLFHATHGNLGTAALTPTSLAARRLAMKSQTEMDSGDKLSIGPRYLWVADDGEEAAVDLFRRNTENDKNFVQSLALEVIPVWYWTDANDWAVTADPEDIQTVELGFMDGMEEPELFVQDSPTNGSMFTHDQITYKIRHIYGGNVVDYRGAQKNVVA